MTVRGQRRLDGDVLPRAPESVTFTFNEDLQERFTTVKVTAAGKGTIEVDRASTDGAKVSQPLPATLAAGNYTVAYRLVSADGHPVTGKTSFRVNAPSPSAPRSALGTAPSSQSATVAAQPRSDEAGGTGPWLWIIGAAVLVLVGAVLAVRRSRRRPAGA